MIFFKSALYDGQQECFIIFYPPVVSRKMLYYGITKSKFILLDVAAMDGYEFNH